MIRRALQHRLRLVDAVAIAAGAMLLLRAIGMTAGSEPADDAQAARTSSDPLPAFARVLAHARTNYVAPDVGMTGSVPAKKDEPKPDAAGKEAVTKEGPSASAAAMLSKPVSPTEQALLERLGTRRDELQQRGRDLDLRERLLENTEKRLDARLNELKAAEEKTGEANAKRTEGEGGLRNLVTMYETMKPKDASRVFDRLSLDVLVPVVLAMNPRKMAEILAVMSPEAAERLTVALANRARGHAPQKAEQAAAALPTNELPGIADTPAAAAR